MILSKINILLTQTLPFLILFFRDTYFYIKNKEYKKFKGYGIHTFVNLFGAGKTSSAVYEAYKIAKKFPEVTILSNIELKNFPEHTKIIELTEYKQIVEAPEACLIILDECSTIFNARDWKTDGIPAVMLETLFQVRKERKMMFCTAQLFEHVDKQIRDVNFTVKACSCIKGRWNIVTTYNAKQYENHKDNTISPPKPIKITGFIQNDFVRSLYDTKEMVKKMKKAKYISDKETRENRSNNVITLAN